MKILEKDLQNMRTFSHQSWKVPTGVSLITGANGTGKSTLMGIAAAWTIWGKAPGRSQDYLVRHGEREMKASLRIEDNNRVFSIERRFLMNKNGKGGTTQLSLRQLHGDGSWHDHTGPINKDTQAEINKLFGPYEVWAMTAYVGQREGAGQFLQANGYERKEILRSLIVNGDHWELLEISAKEKKKEFEDALIRAEGSISDLEETVADIPNRQGQVEAATSQVENTARIFLETSYELASAVDKEAKISEAQVAWDAIKDKTFEAGKVAASALGADIKANSDLSVQVLLSKELPDLEASLAKQRNQVAVREREIADVQATNVEIAERNAESLKLDVEDLEVWSQEELARVEAKNAAVASINGDIERHQLHIKQSHEIASILEQISKNICAECNSVLTDEHSQVLVDRQAVLVREMNGEPNPLEAAEAILALEKLEHPPAVERPSARPQAWFVDVPTSATISSELTDDVIAARSAASEVERLKPIAVLATEARDLANELFESAKAKFVLALERPDGVEIHAEVTRLEGVEQRAADVNDEANRALTVAQTQLDNATTSKVTLTERRNKIGEIKVDLHQWTQVAAATGTNGVRQLIIDQSVGAMETASNRWLQVVAPGFGIAFSTQTDTDRETFEEGVIMPSGQIQPWSELSGAQSVAVALAVRLALAEVGGAAYGVRYETLYLDEADAWLSGEYQKQFMDYLSRVAATGIDVVAITHIEAVQDMIDQKTIIRAIDSETSEIK